MSTWYPCGRESHSGTCMLNLLCFLGQVEVGVVYSCLEDKMFTARRGKGAFCNGDPLAVSDQTG